MPRFAEKYTDAQRTALCAYAIDHRVPARRAIEEAEAGRLTGEPFTMPLKTAQDYIGKERRRRAAQARPDAATLPPARAVDSLTQRLVAVADKKIAALERKGPNAPVREAIAVARLLAEITKLDPAHRGTGTSAPTAPGAGADTPSAPPAGFMDALVAEAASASPASQTPTQPQGNTETNTTGTDESGPAPNSHNGNTPTSHDGGVPSRATSSAPAAAGHDAPPRSGALALYPE